jgi:hypothetical protein
MRTMWSRRSAATLNIERNHYLIRQSLTSIQRGHDIMADKQGDPTWRLYVEAKGEGSSKPTTARYGM